MPPSICSVRAPLGDDCVASLPFDAGKVCTKNWCSQASFVVSILCEVGLNKEGEKKVAGATRKLVCVSPSLVGSRQLEDRRRELGGKELEIGRFFTNVNFIPERN